jgi:hypothetical protein
MRQKKGFRLRTVCGENFIVAEGLTNIDFSSIISMNDSSAFLWKKVEGTEFNVDDLVSYLCEEYEVDEPTAKDDISLLVKTWKEAGIVED